MTAMTDEQIIDLWSPRLGEGIQRPVLGKNKIIAFGRACIAAERARADALEAALLHTLRMEELTDSDKAVIRALLEKKT